MQDHLPLRAGTRLACRKDRFFPSIKLSLNSGYHSIQVFLAGAAKTGCAVFEVSRLLSANSSVPMFLL
jgi:hypothetical protein